MEKMAGLSGNWVLVKRAWLAAVCIIQAIVLPRKPHDNNTQSTFIHRVLLQPLAFLMLLGLGTQVHAGAFCSDAPWFGTIDANDPTHLAALGTQVTIDTDCSFLNFSAPNPELTVTINFQTNDPSIYLIVFDNTVFTGNMACSNIDHKIWFVNGADYGSKNSCQDLFIPVETIDKQEPAQTTVGIGEVFTYTLTLPSMQFTGLPSTKELRDVIIQDDLAATGADLTFISANAYEAGTLTPVALVPETNPASLCGVWTATNLCYEPIPSIAAGTQVIVEFTVAVADTAGNTPGTQFTNTARWWFGRWIDLNDDGIETPDEQFEPLPGENGISGVMTIGEPDLVVNKSSPDTALNVGVQTTFTIDVQNNGGSNAYNVTVDDLLPDGATEGMCDYDPTATPGEVTAAIYEANGTTLVRSLTLGADYTATHNGASDAPPCQLTFQMTSSNTVIAPTQRLIITYVSQLDTVPIPVNNGAVLTNYVGATQYYSGDGSYPRTGYSNTITDGSPGTDDFQDSYDMTTALVGYVFQKTVQNVTTGANPTTTAAPGDTVRYRLRLFNFTETIDDIDVTDTLDPTRFDLTSFTMVTPPPANATYTFNNLTGDLHIFGTPTPGDFDLVPPSEFLVEFDVDVLTTLNDGDSISNQAFFTSSGTITNGESDDPYVNGIAAPADPGDPTVITILAPGPLIKTAGQVTATIGNQFTYDITVPDTPINAPLYDVRILDDLTASSADISFVSASVVSGGSWVLSNTGTSTNLVIEDTSTGIDIPALGQAVIRITVQLDNSSTNQAGLFFNNSASYTFNWTNGNNATQSPGGGDTSANMLVLEPNISNVVKLANNTTPTAGGIIRYSVTLLADGGATNSDVFDVDLFDTLDLGLVYEGNPTVSVTAGVGADNTIGAPDITGDGITTPQTLYWGLNSTVSADIDIPAGSAVTISYDVRVLDSVLALQALNNSVYATWTGVDGASAVERDGSDGVGLLNDYITTPVVETVTTQDVSATINKIHSNDTYGAVDDIVRIGDIVEYTLTINSSEGTLGNLTLVDTLPQGLDFEGVVSINTHTGPDPFSQVFPVTQFTYTDIPLANIVEAGNPATGPSTVTWNLGNITNQPNDGVSDDFVIIYRARVMDSVLAQASLNIPLNNTISMTYDKSTGPVVETDIDTVITALQPQLSVTKSASPAGGDILIVANELIGYTVTVTNNGTAPAYDTVLQDTIPVGLRNGAATITMVSTTLGGVGVANVAPVYNAGTGVATWDFDTGVADAYTIDPGESLVIVYQVQADAALAAGLTMTNAAVAANYYSFDDEAIPTLGAVSGTREVYGPSNTASTTLYTASPPSKALISPVSSEATIGEEILYRITVPGTVAASTFYDLQVTDTLDANLELVSVNVTGGNGLVDTSTATQMNLSFTDVPAGTQAVIDLRVRIRNVISAQQGVDIDNAVSYTYAYAPAGATQPVQTSTDIVTVNVVEPHINAMTKIANNLAPTAGDIVRYSVAMTTAGGVDSSDVFDVTLTDTLDLGLAYEGNPTVTVGAGVSADNTIGAPVITGDGVAVPQTLVWSLANGNADIDIVEGTVVTVQYDVRVLNGVLANQVLNNTVVADWTGIDGVNANERDGSDGIGNLNDYVTAPVIETLNTPAINATINKVRSTDTYGAGDDNVRIGDIVEYTVTLNIPEGTLGNAQIIDTLPQGLDFEAVVSINGDTAAPYSAVAPFAHSDIAAASIVEAGNPATGPTTVTWNLGNVTNLPNDGLADDFVVVYRARVLNNVLPTASLNIPLNNLVDITYDTATVPVTNSDIDTIITALQPSLTASKSAAPAGGDNIIVANEVVQYTVSVINGGTAPAYDLVLQDIIPAGMRYGAATVTMVSTTLGGVGVANVTPTYDPVTGVAIWNFDTGVADAYTIGVGETLTIVYQAQADADLGAGITLTNAATGTNYYSFDDEAVPGLGGINGDRQVYGPTNTATTTLNSQAVIALSKTNPVDTTVSVGETFTYRITVPSAPLQVALHDVRITDNFVADSAADLSFVSVTRVSGSQPWTPVNTGSATSIVIEDTTDGIDIPAGEQIEIDVTVVVMDTGTNTSGLPFTNTADYTYNQFDDTPASQQNGLPGTTGVMQIVGPDTFTMNKSGPVNIQVGTPETYQLEAHNTGTAPAYDLTITDILPNPVPGGMCDVAPYNFVAQIYTSLGVAVGAPLVENTDYITNFVNGSPTCTLTFTMTSLAAAVPEDHVLRINYTVALDTDSPAGVALTNYAGASEWFSGDTAGAGAMGQIRTYTETFDGIDPGTVGTLDDEDAHTVTTASPVVQFTKDVYNVTTSQPGTTASPGDTLRYTITATNVSPVSAPNFSIVDDLGALNATAMFETGSLANIVAPGTADTSNSDPNGGTNNSGLVDIRNLSLDAMGGANDSVTVQFDVTLVPVIDSGTLVYNQASFQIIGVQFFVSDDPNVSGLDNPFVLGDEQPTQTLINSAPDFLVEKTSADITGSPTQLLPGETLRYTITVKNIGTENAVNTTLTDQVPPLTTYVAGSTTLNGVAVVEATPGVSPLVAGMLINAPAPEDTTPGNMRADADPAVTSNIATITFDVVVDANVVNGAIISNQGYINADGAGSSGPIPQQPSDDPTTPIADDPTLNVVGNLPFVDAQKTVVLSLDNGTPNQVDPLDELRYTITVTNYGNVPATGVTLTDAVPTNTTFISGSVYLNGEAVPDGGVSPLIAGMPVSSSDQTPPLPTVGYLSPGETATITFDVQVVGTANPGDQIVNQGTVANNETPDEPTDADGIDSNGDQATVVVVGNAQLLTISKQVSVVGGGAALANGYLEYVVVATNVSTVDAYNVEIQDVINTLQMTFVPGSEIMNGLATGVTYDGGTNTLTADYFNTYGVLRPGETVELRFRVQLANLPMGTQVSNTGTVYWNAMTQSASDTVTIDVGGIPGVANLNGRVWHDADFDNTFAVETPLENWEVRVFFRGVLLDSVFTDVNGQYQVLGLPPNFGGADDYQLRFYEPGTSSTTAKLGEADSPFSDDLHHIYNILVASGTNTQDLNLPIDPNGVIYDSIVRIPVAGATVRLLDASAQELPASCFDDPAQREQVTLANGYYKFDINFSQPECTANSEYLVQVTPPATGYIIRDPAPLGFNYSVAIPPQTSVTTASYDVPACPADAVGITAHCEVLASAAQPGTSIPPRTAGTVYHMRITLNNGAVPEDSQLFNNHIALDPDLTELVTVTKTTPKVNVVRGDLVPYTIVVSNTLPVALDNVSIWDVFPPGFKYVRGSARFDGVKTEPVINGQLMEWNVGTIGVDTQHTIKLLLIVGSGVQEGEYENDALVWSYLTSSNISGTATATVRVVPDPTFDCTDIIGKVFDDKNLNGVQDSNEPGLPGVRLATARGLLVSTDKHGRYHVTCAAVPNEQRGSNFIIKLDDRTLPTGYRVTTENPRVQRVTRGKFSKFNFGATIHRVITLDVADGVFETNSTEMRGQWVPRLGLLIEELRKGPSVLRITYLGDVEDSGLVKDRVNALKRRIVDHWRKLNGYKLTIETEIFWRHGKPVDNGGFD